MSSPVITTGFGTFGTINLLPTLGFNSETAEEVHGVIVRRGKVILWPEWEQEKKDLARVESEIAELRAERDQLLNELRKSRSDVSAQSQRLRIAKDIEREQAYYRSALAKLARERKEASEAVARKARMREEFLKIRAEQEDEDMQAIRFMIENLYD
jgi:chromosome segregation ATPase